MADYLKTLPDADKRPALQPISAEDTAALMGEYVFGPGADERIVIAVAASNGLLTFTRTGRSARNRAHVRDRVFFPVGAPRVQIRFRSSAAGMTLSVHDPDLVVEVRRVPAVSTPSRLHGSGPRMA